MEETFKIFHQNNLVIRKSSSSFPLYPGTCDQCALRNQGTKTFLLEYIPGTYLILCNVCHEAKKTSIQKSLKLSQKETQYYEIKELVQNQTDFCIQNGLFIENGWNIDVDYQFFPIFKKKIYIPMKKSDKICFVPLSDFKYLNYGHVPT